MWYGFNMLWFFSAGGETVDLSAQNITIDENELDFIANMGCNFVRIPTDYRYFVHDFKYDEYDETYLRLLDDAIKAVVSRGLHCSLNVHRGPGYCINGNEFERDNLWTDKIAQDAFVNLWTMFAKRYSAYTADELSFDLLNEPPAEGQYGLTRQNHKAIMARVTQSIRAVTVDRTIVCDGLGGGHLATPELADLDVVMSGRGYMPFRLTHYKAEWCEKDGSNEWAYPNWPGLTYDGTEWNRQALRDFYEPWKALKESGCRVHIGECGCYNKVRNETALAWYRDFFGVLNELGFGFALWNFRGPFGIADHGREGTNLQEINGIRIDKDLYELFKESMKN